MKYLTNKQQLTNANKESNMFILFPFRINFSNILSRKDFLTACKRLCDWHPEKDYELIAGSSTASGGTIYLHDPEYSLVEHFNSWQKIYKRKELFFDFITTDENMSFFNTSSSKINMLSHDEYIRKEKVESVDVYSNNLSVGDDVVIYHSGLNTLAKGRIKAIDNFIHVESIDNKHFSITKNSYIVKI